MKTKPTIVKASDSPYTPVAKGDVLSTVRLYQRTDDKYDKAAIAVCIFKRNNRDLARLSGTSSACDMTYAKIGPAGFSVHNDAPGVLFFHINAYGGDHFRALLKLGVRHISVTTFGAEHGSESSRKAGLLCQHMSAEVAALKTRLDYTRVSTLGEWWETLDGPFMNQPKVFSAANEYRWGDIPILWVGGLTFDGIKAEQAAARATIAAREAS